MDAYDLQARHAPAAFACVPLVLVAVALVPGFGAAKYEAGSIAFILLVAVAFVATRFARSSGRARQNHLYTAWGGQPTTAMLRFRDTRLNPQTKQIYRDRLRRLGNRFPIPDEEDERRNPQDADVKIGAAIDEVRRQAKQKGIKSVHRENINYGAARNAYGLKPFGLGACLVAAVTLAFAISRRGGFSPNPFEIAIAMAILVIAIFWLAACTPNTVRQHAEAYALELFEAIEVLVPVPRKRTPAAQT